MRWWISQNLPRMRCLGHLKQIHRKRIRKIIVRMEQNLFGYGIWKSRRLCQIKRFRHHYGLLIRQNRWRILPLERMCWTLLQKSQRILEIRWLIVDGNPFPIIGYRPKTCWLSQSLPPHQMVSLQLVPLFQLVCLQLHWRINRNLLCRFGQNGILLVIYYPCRIPLERP